MPGFMAWRAKFFTVEKLSSSCILWYVASTTYDKYAYSSYYITTSTYPSENSWYTVSCMGNLQHTSMRRQGKAQCNAMQGCLKPFALASMLGAYAYSLHLIESQPRLASNA
jgi:hypothetical protein